MSGDSSREDRWDRIERQLDEAFGGDDDPMLAWFPELAAERALIKAKFRARVENLEREHQQTRAWLEAFTAHRDAVSRALERLDGLNRPSLRRMAVLDVRCPHSPGKGRGGCVVLTVYRTGPGFLARPGNPLQRASFLQWAPEITSPNASLPDVTEPGFGLRCRHGNGVVKTGVLAEAVRAGRRVIGPPRWTDRHPGT